MWSNATSIPIGIDAAVAGATTGEYATKRIYVFGGFTESSYSPRDIVQVYDPETEVWSSGVSMLTPHANFGVAVLNDELYVIGGSQIAMKPPSVTNERYTPSGYGTPDSFTPSPSFSPSWEPTSTPEPELDSFPIIPIIVTFSAVVIAGVSLLAYFKKRKH